MRPPPLDERHESDPETMSVIMMFSPPGVDYWMATFPEAQASDVEDVEVALREMSIESTDALVRLYDMRQETLRGATT